MKRLFIILLNFVLLTSICACNKTDIKDNISAPEVTVKLPRDDSVNGYRTESSDSINSMPLTISGNEVGVSSESNDKTSLDYCGNKNSKVFHRADCSSVKKMKDTNKYFASKETLTKNGYSPCSHCKP